MLAYKIEQFHHACQDLHVEYVQHGVEDRFYSDLAELLDRTIDLCEEAGCVVPALAGEFARLLDTVYRIDPSHLDNWHNFVWAMKTKPGGERIIAALIGRDHRKPPKPKWYYVAQRGHCKLCGGAILRGDKLDRRRNWHETCLQRYRQIYWPKTTRDFIWDRDRGVCRLCGAFDVQWQMDHVRPLIESKGDIAFWMPENIQTLCRAHHIRKTSEENSQRSASKLSL